MLPVKEEGGNPLDCGIGAESMVDKINYQACFLPGRFIAWCTSIKI